MKETIERLKMLADMANRYNWIDESKVEIKMSDVRALIDFYESRKSEAEQPPSVPGISPDWSSIDQKYNWVAVDPDGVEVAFIRKPSRLEKYMHGCNAWTGRNMISTGRFIDMKGIDWKRTLSRRPARNG